MEPTRVVILTRGSWEERVARVIFPTATFLREGASTMGLRVAVLLRTYPAVEQEQLEAAVGEERERLQKRYEWEHYALATRLLPGCEIIPIELARVIETS